MKPPGAGSVTAARTAVVLGSTRTMLVATGPMNCARVRLPLPTHSAPAPAARSVGTPPEPNVLTARVRSSTRVIVWSSALSTQAAPSPTATLVGVPPTSNVALSRPVSRVEEDERIGGRAAEGRRRLVVSAGGDHRDGGGERGRGEHRGDVAAPVGPRRRRGPIGGRRLGRRQRPVLLEDSLVQRPQLRRPARSRARPRAGGARRRTPRAPRPGVPSGTGPASAGRAGARAPDAPRPAPRARRPPRGAGRARAGRRGGPRRRRSASPPGGGSAPARTPRCARSPAPARARARALRPGRRPPPGAGPRRGRRARARPAARSAPCRAGRVRCARRSRIPA